jgi:4-hydroxythreonine-4-phosphate dehydrogenase
MSTASPRPNDGPRPRIALTLGDVAGIGPEVVVRAWDEPGWREATRPFVVGPAAVLRRAIASLGLSREVASIHEPAHLDRIGPEVIACLEAGPAGLEEVPLGRVDARAGLGAYAFLNAAIDLALAGRIDAIVTLPLNKEALRAAGVPHPGHTEILAERCGVGEDFAMMLYLGRPLAAGPSGLGVLHATLHVPLRRVFELLTIDRVRDTIALADRALRPLTEGRRPRVAVAGLNPHAGENGLFGDEEARVIAPAVAEARTALGVDVVGPEPADTLFARAVAGDFDAVVAMYHDQGHVALKTIGFDRAVNVTLGLPIVRTSVAHGTAFDIAGTGLARPDSLIEAVSVAGRLVAGRRGPSSA